VTAFLSGRFGSFVAFVALTVFVVFVVLVVFVGFVVFSGFGSLGMGSQCGWGSHTGGGMFFASLSYVLAVVSLRISGNRRSGERKTLGSRVAQVQISGARWRGRFALGSSAFFGSKHCSLLTGLSGTSLSKVRILLLHPLQVLLLVSFLEMFWWIVLSSVSHSDGMGQIRVTRPS